MALTVKHNTLTTESGSTPPIGAVQWDEAHEIIGTVSLATEVAGTLPIANGGTNATSASAALTSLGAYPATNPSGYTANVGSVTSVAGAGTVSGLTLTGSVTSTGSLTLGGTLSLTSGNVTTALGYTPYDATNPTGYITSSALSSYLTSATAATTYQPIDGDLTAIAALAGTTGIVRKTATDTYTLDTATYLTGITSGQVTTALGYTPYNATNPSAYLSTVSLTSNVTGTLPAANGGTGITSPGTAGNVLTSNGSAWVSQLPAAGGIKYTTVKTANYTAVANDGVQTNTSGGAFTVTLPATPAVGDQIVVTDSAGSWATNNLTVGRNGSTIEGLAEDLTCDIPGISVQLIYNGTTWDVFAQAGGAGTDFGDLIGPASSTDNAITRFDATTGKLVQNSLVTVADNGAITAPQVGSIIPFYFNNQAAFPSASTYHGALAHSHADGAMFFAHGGVWSRLLDVNTTVTVAQGGTGAATLTGYIKGSGTSALTASATIPTSDLSGTIATSSLTGTLGVANGGTGAATLTGYVKASGTSTMTASAAIPVADVTGAAPLASPTFTGTVTTATADLLGPVRGNIVAVAALDIDCSAGNYFTKTIAGNSTFTFSNVPASRAFAFTLELTHTSGTVAWPASVKWPADTAPTLTTGKTHLFTFVTDDGGTRFRGVAQKDYVN